MKSRARTTAALLRSLVAALLLIGVPEPVLLGATAAFYGAIAKDYHLPFEAKILEELLFDRQFKSDPIHPNARGYRRLAEAMADLLRKAGAV